MYEQLSGLCRDASWLKSYMAAALLVSKETFQATALALGPTKQPLPSFGLERAAVKTHGAVAGNEALAAEMPKVGGLLVDGWGGEGRRPCGAAVARSAGCCGVAVASLGLAASRDARVGAAGGVGGEGGEAGLPAGGLLRWSALVVGGRSGGALPGRASGGSWR